MTGRLVRPDERFARALTSARCAEQFGYDAIAVFIDHHRLIYA